MADMQPRRRVCGTCEVLDLSFIFTGRAAWSNSRLPSGLP